MPHAPKCKGYILSCAILMVSICMCVGGGLLMCVPIQTGLQNIKTKLKTKHYNNKTALG